MRRSPRLSAFFLCLGGYSAVTHAAPQSAELEVVGQLTIHAEVEPTDEGHQIIRGKMTDEVGAPVGGTVVVQTPGGRPARVQQCPWLSLGSVPSPRKQLEAPGTVVVGADGSFCFVAEEAKGLVLEAHSEHFLETVHDLDLGRERALSRPSFGKAPATMDLHLDESHVVEILARSEARPPKDARLILSLQCDEAQVLGEGALEQARMQRFEFRAPLGARPGNCKLVATVSAPHHKPLSATRSVLLRDEVQLGVAGQRQDSKLFTFKVRAAGLASSNPSQKLDEGLIEARQEGAFTGLGPVRNGIATLEFETSQAPRRVELSYVPASSAYLPGAPLVITVPARTAGFRWAGVHTAALIAFCFWLGYAWLRPQKARVKRNVPAPPGQPSLRGSGRKVGPITGRVLDAHTGDPLAGMVVLLSEIGAEANRTLEEAKTDVNGAFSLETHLESHPLLQLSVRGDGYMSLSSHARGTELTVHLTERRRALVQGLVSWARKTGRPWDKKPAATPDSVEKTAVRQGEEEKATWARRVAVAAYGPKGPSEATARSLQSPELPSETASSTVRGG